MDGASCPKGMEQPFGRGSTALSLIEMGIGLVCEEAIAGANHLGRDIGVEIERPKDRRLFASPLAKGLKPLAVGIQCAFGHCGAMRSHQKCIVRTKLVERRLQKLHQLLPAVRIDGAEWHRPSCKDSYGLRIL